MNQLVTLAEKQNGEVGGEVAEKAEKQNKSQCNHSDKGGEAGGEASGEALFFLYSKEGMPRSASRRRAAGKKREKKGASKTGSKASRPVGRRPLTASDKTRQLGFRKVLWREDEITVDTFGAWMIVHCTTQGRDGYKTVKLLYGLRSKKNVYYLNYRDGQLVMSRDGGLLIKYHPGIYYWVVESLEKHFADLSS